MSIACMFTDRSVAVTRAMSWRDKMQMRFLLSNGIAGLLPPFLVPWSCLAAPMLDCVMLFDIESISFWMDAYPYGVILAATDMLMHWPVHWLHRHGCACMQVPISLVYNKHVVKPQSASPLLLDAYGAYGIINSPRFSRERVSLLDRGVVFAIAHVRGGGEMGRQWYETGKFLDKTNTFKDVIAVAEHLIEQRWTLPQSLVLEGRSAGGMTVGAVGNMRPELFHVCHLYFRCRRL